MKLDQKELLENEFDLRLRAARHRSC